LQQTLKTNILQLKKKEAWAELIKYPCNMLVNIKTLYRTITAV